MVVHSYDELLLQGVMNYRVQQFLLPKHAVQIKLSLKNMTLVKNYVMKD